MFQNLASTLTKTFFIMVYFGLLTLAHHYRLDRVKPASSGFCVFLKPQKDHSVLATPSMWHLSKLCNIRGLKSTNCSAAWYFWKKRTARGTWGVSSSTTSQGEQASTPAHSAQTLAPVWLAQERGGAQDKPALGLRSTVTFLMSLRAVGG